MGTKLPSRMAEFCQVWGGQEENLTYVFFAVNCPFLCSQNIYHYYQGKLLETAQDLEKEGIKIHV